MAKIIDKTDIVDEATMKKYAYTFIRIHRRILNPVFSYSIRCFVSMAQGAMVWFQFIQNKKPKFSFQYIDGPISQILSAIPQQAFKFSPSTSVLFEGTNIVRENNKLLIIKGSNRKDAWSIRQAELDAMKEVDDIIRAMEVASTKDGA